MKTRYRILRCTAVILTALLLPGLATARGVSDRDGFLTIGAVQFAVSESVYASQASFEQAIREALDAVENQAASRGAFPDLVVFPEYTSAFLGLSVLSDADRARLGNGSPDRTTIEDALVRTHRDMVDTWRKISSDKPYAILGGTHLNLDSSGNLRNRAHLYSGGEIVWRQDKVFPGAPERDLLQLKPGSLDDAEPFEIDGFSIVTTICRDTYNEVWETILPDADLWIDIKANELPYTMEYYDKALTARLPGSPIDRGLTVSLSGSLLGFTFSGPTEYLHDDGPIAGTDPWAENAVMIISLPARQ